MFGVQLIWYCYIQTVISITLSSRIALLRYVTVTLRYSRVINEPLTLESISVLNRTYTKHFTGLYITQRQRARVNVQCSTLYNLVHMSQY